MKWFPAQSVHTWAKTCSHRTVRRCANRLGPDQKGDPRLGWDKRLHHQNSQTVVDRKQQWNSGSKTSSATLERLLSQQIYCSVCYKGLYYSSILKKNKKKKVVLFLCFYCCAECQGETGLQFCSISSFTQVWCFFGCFPLVFSFLQTTCSRSPKHLLQGVCDLIHLVWLMVTSALPSVMQRAQGVWHSSEGKS